MSVVYVKFNMHECMFVPADHVVFVDFSSSSVFHLYASIAIE